MTYTIPHNGYSQTAQPTEPQPTKLHIDIQHYLPKVSPEQIDRLARLIVVHQGLKQFAEENSAEVESFQHSLSQLQDKNLNYKKPFRIAVVAMTGVGKSTLLNAILARPLVLVKGAGGAATGCALQIFQDVAQDGVENASIEYRDEANIRELIDKHFIRRYELESFQLAGALDEGFAAILSELEPPNSLSEDEQGEFRELRAEFIDLIKQYARNHHKLHQTKFFLNKQEDVSALFALIQEDSELNRSSNRRIGLVKVVNYHIRPGQSQDLHQNVCLVDLPGVDGSGLHNIIIHEGIEEADAVLFVVHPRRFRRLGNTALLRRVRRHIAIEGDPRSAERIFLVVNAKDEVSTELQQTPHRIHAEIDQFMEDLIPGSSQFCPRFLVCAWAALQAQQLLRGQPIADLDKYEATKILLGVRDGDDQTVLMASEVPSLVQRLTHFIKHRTEYQIREADQTLERILTILMAQYDEDYQKRLDETSLSNPQQRLNRVLMERLEQLEQLIKSVRRTQIDRISEARQRLQQVAVTLCDEIDRALQTEMPDYWKMHFYTAEYEPHAGFYAAILKEGFLGQVEINLWEQIASKVKRLAYEIVGAYKRALEMFDLPSQIVEQGFEQFKVDNITEKLEIGVERMQENLLLAVKGLILAQVVDPAHGFITLSQNGLEQSHLLETLKIIPRERELRDTAFDEFVRAMRQHYESFVTEACISGLLNLYRYEMLRCERSLIHYLRNCFEEIRRSGDPTVLLQRSDLSSNPDLQQMTMLEQKLNILKQLKEQLGAAHRL